MDDDNPQVSASARDESGPPESQVEPRPALQEAVNDALMWRRMDLPGMDAADERE